MKKYFWIGLIFIWITKVWADEGLDDDVVILPSEERSIVPKINIQLRNQKSLSNGSAPKKAVAPKPAPVLNPPAPMVVKPLSKKQIIRQDMAREQTLLRQFEQKYAQAKHQNDVAKIQKWSHLIQESRANLRSFENELKRF